MQVVHERCAGLDVHKKTVVACRIYPDEGNRRKWRKEIVTFGTMTHELRRLKSWLAEVGVTHVAIESTGVYWKPVYNVLESTVDVMLVNARHVKYVPGRKTDVKDAQWLGELLQHGLLKASYIPERTQRDLRDLTRYRQQVTQERTREANRIHKILEDANIKLSSVATSVMGASGVAMMQAMIEGEEDATVLADLAKGVLRKKMEQLIKALDGFVTDHHRLLLKLHFRHLDLLQEQLDLLDEAIADTLTKLEANEAVGRLQTIPGVGYQVAVTIVAEFGLDMSRFPNSAHASSWAGLAPGRNESGGKTHSSRITKGNKYLKVALVQAAHGLGRTKGNYLNALYRRLSSRRGRKRAAIATARSVLVIAYHMLKNGTEYQDLGSDYFDKRDEQRTQKRLIKRLESMGLEVTITPVAV